MSALSADSQKSWKTTPQERPAGLEIVLLKRTYVLPWNQFLYAEGGDEEIRLAFTTHDVLIKGTGLGVLLIDFAAQRIARLQQPTRADHFSNGTGPSIRELSVTSIESSRTPAGS
jgi:hypothetical protein